MLIPSISVSNGHKAIEEYAQLNGLTFGDDLDVYDLCNYISESTVGTMLLDPHILDRNGTPNVSPKQRLFVQVDLKDALDEYVSFPARSEARAKFVGERRELCSADRRSDNSVNNYESMIPHP